jgi:2-keto-4-pentenoate hydratase/2-oxohepta-3-ene-1,7-dioic acid hydratase in catechol pathway
MRFVSYWDAAELAPGVVVDDRVFDVATLMAAPSSKAERRHSSVRELLEAYGENLDELAEILVTAAVKAPSACVDEIANLRLGPPVPDPAKVVCVGHNYHAHVAETGGEVPEHPNLFVKFATSLTGATDDLVLSEVSQKLDYEGELAVVIRTACRRVSPEQAMGHVAGAMILNDITARDLQFNATQWLPGKAVDSSTPCGPELVTLDELGDPQDLELVTRVNGGERQRSRTDRMIFPIAQVISYISQFLELSPGDVIATGTPEGIGSRLEPPSFLGPGDVVEVEITGLGALRNTIR